MNLTLRQKVNGGGCLAKGDLRVFLGASTSCQGFSHPDESGFEKRNFLQNNNLKIY